MYARIERMGILLNLEGWGFIKHIIMHKMYLSCHPEKLYLMFPMNGRWIKDLSLHKKKVVNSFSSCVANSRIVFPDG